MRGKVSDPQRAASSRYRERNKDDLRRKARERMAKRRAELKNSEEAWAAYTAKAREDSARYRSAHAETLAQNQAAYRAKRPRHPAPAPAPQSAPYDDHLNYFLDYLDPTIAPDYVPKPGQSSRKRKFYILIDGFLFFVGSLDNPNQTKEKKEKKGAYLGVPALLFGFGAKPERDALNALQRELGVLKVKGAGTARLDAPVVGFEDVIAVRVGRHDPIGEVEAGRVAVHQRLLNGFAIDVVVLGGFAIGKSVPICPRTFGLSGVRGEGKRAAAGDGGFGMLENRILVDALAAANPLEVVAGEDKVLGALFLCLLLHTGGGGEFAGGNDDRGYRSAILDHQPSVSFHIHNEDSPLHAARHGLKSHGALYSLPCDDISFPTPLFHQPPPSTDQENQKCPPKFGANHGYFPQPGHEDTVAHDGRKDGRYFVVGAGHCGNGVFTDPIVANKQTDGFSGYHKRSAKRWTGVGGVEDLWASFCDELHQGGCHPPTRLPEGWDAPVPVVRGCPPAPAAAHPASAAAVPAAEPPFPSINAPRTPRASDTTGSGNTSASPLFVHSSASSSPLPPPPQYHTMAPTASGSPRPRTALNPGGNVFSSSAGSSMLSAFGSTLSSSLSSSSQSSSATWTPKKSTQSRGYDTDYFYDNDSDDEKLPRQWAVRGLDELFPNVDEAFDALRQSLGRLKYMEVRSSRNLAKLRRFAAS
ncbi:hypothetical protein C8F04DRAFT_1203936 [Mycena alexandri]|uniref:Uncharacterized protein n=1 Tax=Mycena alexandri TaxID=1745969 RepID=A0AAD6RW49_9AGAR|nr:hypothetical protein C8F04DRAFT_1203936 [Mycena alexandri]